MPVAPLVASDASPIPAADALTPPPCPGAPDKRYYMTQQIVHPSEVEVRVRVDALKDDLRRAAPAAEGHATPP